MSRYGDELRDCLREILGTVPPPPEGDALLFFKQWLAERNLGLVPIDNAASFEWPGRWLARVRATDHDHAVVMFGAPSGAIFDPAGALANRGTIQAGWLVAPLDLELPIDNPYDIDAGVGSVAGLLLAAEAEAPLIQVDEALAIAGRGLEGDRYAAGHGTFQRTRPRLRVDADRGGGPRRDRPLLGTGAKKHRDSRCRSECPCRTPLRGGVRRVRRPPPRGALLSPRRPRPRRAAAPAPPPGRVTRRHRYRRPDQARRQSRSVRLTRQSLQRAAATRAP
jgi:hypothetical protein